MEADAGTQRQALGGESTQAGDLYRVDLERGERKKCKSQRGRDTGGQGPQASTKQGSERLTETGVATKEPE